MGVVLTPIVTKNAISLSQLHGRTLAVDGNGELYQFLALIRLRDGTPLQDSKGRDYIALVGIVLPHDAVDGRTRAEAGVRLRWRPSVR